MGRHYIKRIVAPIQDYFPKPSNLNIITNLQNKTTKFQNQIQQNEKILEIYNTQQLYKVEKILNYKFKNKSLLVSASVVKKDESFDNLISFNKLAAIGHSAFKMSLTHYVNDKKSTKPNFRLDGTIKKFIY